MTAAGPDPSFRDQLAEVLPESLGPVGLRRRAIPALGVEASVTGYGLVLLDALMPTIAAEVEARVQAAANQRAAEELRKLGCEALEATPGAQRVHIPVADLFDRAAALASPAPAPQTGEDGQCGNAHFRLAAGNVCTEPAGHPGQHVATDGCGRPEYVWTTP